MKARRPKQEPTRVTQLTKRIDLEAEFEWPFESEFEWPFEFWIETPSGLSTWPAKQAPLVEFGEGWPGWS